MCAPARRVASAGAPGAWCVNNATRSTNRGAGSVRACRQCVAGCCSLVLATLNALPRSNGTARPALTHGGARVRGAWPVARCLSILAHCNWHGTFIVSILQRSVACHCQPGTCCVSLEDKKGPEFVWGNKEGSLLAMRFVLGMWACGEVSQRSMGGSSWFAGVAELPCTYRRGIMHHG